LSTFASTDMRTSQQIGGEERKIKRELIMLFEEFQDCIDKHTVFGLIAQYDLIDVFEKYAELVEERTWLLQHFCDRNLFRRALLVLASYVRKFQEAKKRGRKKSMKNTFNVDIFYRFSGTILQHEPKELVDNLLQLGEVLNPCKLIPAFMQYCAKRESLRQGSRDGKEQPKENGVNDNKYYRRLGKPRRRQRAEVRMIRYDLLDSNEAIRYFQSVVTKDKSMDAMVHDYLLSLCVAEPGSVYLETFLENGPRPPLFDYTRAIFLCHEHKKYAEMISINEVFGKIEDAIELAITHDVKRAQRLLLRCKSKKVRLMRDSIAAGMLKRDAEVSIASIESAGAYLDLSESRQRYLWSQLFKKIIKRNPSIAGINQALSLITSSGGTIGFRDILSLLHGRLPLDLVKRATLFEISTNRTKSEMFQSKLNELEKRIKAQECIRTKIQEVHPIVPVGAVCSLSGLQLDPISNALVFKCGHLYAQNKVVKLLRSHLAKHPETMFRGCYKQILKENTRLQQIFAPEIMDVMDFGRRERLLTVGMDSILPDEWKQIAEAECILCGLVNITTAMDPLIKLDDEKEQKEMRDWNVKLHGIA